MGISQHTTGTDNARCLIALCSITGHVGKPGTGLHPLRGQNNVQGASDAGLIPMMFPDYQRVNQPKAHEKFSAAWGRELDDKPGLTVTEIIGSALKGGVRGMYMMGENPFLSDPNINKVRKALAALEFLVVQDIFLTETAEFADVVLPAAIWGEKTGCFTNADRTVHISHKAIEPPGEARPDLEIFLDYARRMDFRDKDGAPLIKWGDSEGAFEAFKEVTRGRPCDYTGLSYAKLSQGSGIQWPCNDEYPEGKERLYEDGVFNTSADYCEIYGHDIMTGAEVPPEQYQAEDPRGRAVIKAADYVPPVEQPDEGYPLWLTTGRVVYHWHTRTKTARSAELDRAAPGPFVQLSEEDAADHGIQEGDLVEAETRRGKVRAPAQVGDIEPGHVFVPFHYGYWDDDTQPRAANELTITAWDPVSKQPHFKFAAARIRKV
jgi:predicted molibdopterin-dependent oxidoreductase YjgC